MNISGFSPHPLLRTGHLQTLAGVFWPQRRAPEVSRLHHVALDDGDRIVLHDDCPPDWQPGGRTALLIHGLAGCHTSPYMVRIARKLAARGVRSFRMDLRGCGAGVGLARRPYHSGRSEDAAAALRTIGELCHGSPVALIGFSLGGNITLKLVGESAANLPANLDRAMAVCPPVDLLACVRSLARGVNRLYDRHFVQLLKEQVRGLQKLIPDAPPLPAPDEPRGVFDFDDMFTAPVCGFGTALNYYRLCSSAQFVPEIRIPTLILAADNDPLVPGEVFRSLRLAPAVTLRVERSGGPSGIHRAEQRRPRPPLDGLARRGMGRWRARDVSPRGASAENWTNRKRQRVEESTTSSSHTGRPSQRRSSVTRKNSAAASRIACG